MPARLITVVACAAAVLAPAPVGAQNFPQRALRIVVPFAPGGANDNAARVVAQKFGETFGQPVVVDNRPGGATNVGTDIVAKAPADGHTLLVTNSSLATNLSLYKSLPYDARRDLAPVTLIFTTPLVLVTHPSLPVKNVRELVDYAKANPNKLSNASSGNGTPGHVGIEYLKMMTGAPIVHVPYKGGGAAMTDLLSGQAPIIVGSLLPVVPHLETGRLRALAVTTAQRWYALPKVPTVAETLPGYEVELWFGTMAPRGTPQAIIDRVNDAINKALQTADMKKNLDAQGMTATGGTPQKFGERIRKEYERWVKIVNEAAIKPE